MIIIGIKELKPTGKQKLVTDPFFRWKPQTSLFLQTQLFTNFIRVSSGNSHVYRFLFLCFPPVVFSDNKGQLFFR